MRLLLVSLYGWYVGLGVTFGLGNTLWPNAPSVVVISMLIGASFIGSALAAMAWGRS